MSKKLDELIKNPSFCSMAWNHQFVDASGRVKPCCRYEEKFRPRENNLSNQPLKEIFEGEWMQKIRKKMTDGSRVDGCTRCYQEEGSGKRSLRQRYNSNSKLPIRDLVQIEDPQIRWLELALSNQCNLACRMCDSRYSSRWFEEEKKLFGKTQSKQRVIKIDIANVDPYLDGLVHIKFTGGEPLLTPDHWLLLERLIENGSSKNIFLNYSTNCTVFVKPEWIKLWKKFKSVEVALSFDSVDPGEAEYIRWPEKYSKIHQVTLQFIELSEDDLFSVHLRPTVSALNVWSLPETLSWWAKANFLKKNQVNATHLTHPSFLSIRNLPDSIKKKINKKYEEFYVNSCPEFLKKQLVYIQNYMNGSQDENSWAEFKIYTSKTDKYRNQSLQESIPLFHNIE